MPNGFAYVALLGFPALAALLFRTMPLRPALVATLFAGYLLLPVRTEIDFPLIPTLDKTVIPALCALALCFLSARAKDGPNGGWVPGNRVAFGLVLVFVGSPLLTALVNTDPVTAGWRTIAGLSLYDGVSAALRQFLVLVPFLLGRRYLADDEAHRLLLVAFVVSGLAYSIPILIEIRLSPQLHTWVYGFFPHSFLQQIRDGGFRPVVFLGHSLVVGTFLCMCFIAAAALWRSSRGSAGTQMALATAWFGGILILSKTFGAIVLACLFVPLMRFGSRRTILLCAAMIAGITITYPILRGAGLIPTGAAVDAAAWVSESRAGSLQYRLSHEEILLDKASERPLLGWGSWGRNRVFDPASGRDMSTTDGTWVIVIGTHGWIGYIAHFGLLTLSMGLLVAASRQRGISVRTGALMMILAMNLLDLLPNSSLSPLTWLVAGALLGHAELLARVPARMAPRPGTLAPGSAPRTG